MTMIFVKKHPLLIALFLPFSFGLPSSGGENESANSAERLQIGPINIHIHCYFNVNDPRCKDEPNDEPNTEERRASPINDDTDSDENYNVKVVTTEDGDLDNPVAEVSDDADTDDSPIPPTSSQDLVDEILFYYEPPADSSKYDELENYRSYWLGRMQRRDHLCTACLAIMIQQEIILDKLQEASPSFWDALGYHARNSIRTIVRLIVGLLSCLLFILFLPFSSNLRYF